MIYSLDSLKNIDLEKLYHFYLVYRERAIKKASDEHHISVSTLRHSLNTIEQKLGIKLSEPSKKSFIPTQDATELFQVTTDIIQIFNSSQSNLKANDFEREDKIILVTTTTFANYYLPPIIKEFNEVFPNVTIEVLCGSEYLRALNFAYDVIISPKINNTSLSMHQIGKFRFKFYCAKGVRDKYATVKTPGELKDANLLLFSGQHFLDERIIKNNKVRLISNSYPLLIHACMQGLGILSCFESKTLSNLGLNVDIVDMFPDYITEEDYGYFYYNRLTDKMEMIEQFFSITTNFLKEMGE